MEVGGGEFIEKHKKLLILENLLLCDSIGNISENKTEFLSYIKILDVDASFEWLLKHMPNEDLMVLANASTDWTEKLYYFSYLKK